MAFHRSRHHPARQAAQAFMLQDLYGPQTLLRRRSFSRPRCSIANPAFLRPMVGVKVPAEQLSAYAGHRSGAFTRRPAGGCWPIAPRLLPAVATPSRIELIVADLLPGALPHLQRAPPGPVFSCPARRAHRHLSGQRQSRASSCSRPAPTTRPTSNTLISRNTLASPWSKAPTSPFASAAST